MKTAILITLLLFTSAARKAEPPSLDTFYVIRVGLERQASGQVIYVASQKGGLCWIDPDTGSMLARSDGQSLWKLQAQANGFISAESGSQVQSRRLIVEPEEGAILIVGTDPKALKPFRGTLEWVRKNGGLLTINWVRLDDYLKAVLPSEVPASFHPEALKAQAIAARSYTMRRLNRHRDSGCDLCDGDHCQIYRGVQAEREATNMAVEATNGQVLINANGQVIEAVYSSDCGGHTAANEAAGLGKNPVPYLRGIPDWDTDGKRYCSLSPRTAWEYRVDDKTLSGLFPQLGVIREMKVIERTPAGHTLKVELIGKSGKQVITGPEFRIKLGASRLRSLMITIEKQSDGWLLHGRGAGHGVGMCQWGAQGRALAGQNYEQILQAYYPGTSLQAR
jgi:stage II sporulation protein D